MTSKKIKVACVAIIDSDERILIAKRKAEKFLGGMWEFPGGKLEQGELPKQALFREIKEELNIELCIECLSLITVVNQEYEQFEAEIHFYLVRKWKGIPIGNESQELKWVVKENIYDFLMPSVNKKLIESLLVLI